MAVFEVSECRVKSIFQGVHFIKKYGCHGNQKEALKNLIKNRYIWSLGKPSTKIVQIIWLI